MGKYDFWRTRMNIYSPSVAESLKDSTIQILNDTFQNSPFYTIVQINNIDVECRVESTNKYNIKKLLFKADNTNEIGEIVDYDNSKWLIMDYQNNGIMPFAKIQKINHILKWLDTQNQLQSSPCITTNQTGNIDEENTITLPDGQYKIIIPSTSITQKIKRDKRFIFNSSAWTVTFVDRMTDGLIILTVEEDEPNENDDLEQEIADNITHNYTLTITNGNIVSLQPNNTLQLNIQVTDNDVEVNNLTINYTSSDETICTVENGSITAISEGQAIITCQLDVDNTVQDSIIVDVENIQQDLFTIQINGSNSVVVNQTEIYTALIYKNGTIDNTQTVTWSVNENGILQVIDGTTCKVTMSSEIGSNVILTATLDSDNSVVFNKTISIISLW